MTIKTLSIAVGVAALAGLVMFGCGKGGGTNESHTEITPEGGTGPRSYPIMLALPGDLKIEVRGEDLVLTITAQQDIDLARYEANVSFEGAGFFWESHKPLSQESKLLRAGESAEVILPYDAKMDEGVLQIFPQ